MSRDALRVEGGPIRSLIDAFEEKFFADFRYRSITGDIQILFFVDRQTWRDFPHGSWEIAVFEFEDSDSCKVNMLNTSTLGRVRVRKFIQDYAKKNGLKISNLNVDFEISRASRIFKQTPKSFLKNCVRCGKDIPIASEKCKFCGARQPEIKK
jgi:hypothetical protein